MFNKDNDQNLNTRIYTWFHEMRFHEYLLLWNDMVFYSSFPAIHKVGNVDIFVLPKFEKYHKNRNSPHQLKFLAPRQVQIYFEMH